MNPNNISNGSGIFVVTDPDQEKLGLYKVGKTANIKNTLTALNAARASKDFKLVNFMPCNDIHKAENFIKQALKKRYVANSQEWIKIEEQAALAKITAQIESLVTITNDE